MEDMPFIVLDVSSDEEEEEEKAQLEEEDIGSELIKELLGISDGESKSLISSTVGVNDDDDDGDDCVVLDDDPEKFVTSVEDSSTGSDDLFIVAEKGQIACRDYPHPRHLCANFPFSDTRHERCCNQCHCYVCDSLAPCLNWGNGLSSTDHCHANDKSEIWKSLRKNSRLAKTAQLPASTNNCSSSDVVNSQHNNQFVPLEIARLSPKHMLTNQTSISISTSTQTQIHPVKNLTPQNDPSKQIIIHPCSSLNSTLQNHVSKPITVPIRSTTSNFPILHGANHGRCKKSGSTLVRNRYQSHSVPRYLLGVQNHAIQRERGHGASISLRPQFLYSHVMSKGVDSKAINHDGASSFSNHINLPWQYNSYHSSTGFSNSITCYGQNNGFWVPKNLLSSERSFEPTSLRRANNCNGAYGTPEYYHQSNDSKNFYGYYIQDNDALPSSYVANVNRNQYLNVHQDENAYGNIFQDDCQQKPHDESQSESTIEAYFPSFDSSWAESTSNGISYVQNSGFVNIPNNAKEFGTQFSGNINLSVDDIEHWLFDEKEFVLPVEVDGAVASQQNDRDMFLFDFENSWNVLNNDAVFKVSAAL